MHERQRGWLQPQRARWGQLIAHGGYSSGQLRAVGGVDNRPDGDITCWG